MFLLAPVTSATFPSNGLATYVPLRRRPPADPRTFAYVIRKCNTHLVGAAPGSVGRRREHQVERGDRSLDDEVEGHVVEPGETRDHPGHAGRGVLREGG